MAVRPHVQLDRSLVDTSLPSSTQECLEMRPHACGHKIDLQNMPGKYYDATTAETSRRRPFVNDGNHHELET
jgi:hypothetical protein